MIPFLERFFFFSMAIVKVLGDKSCVLWLALIFQKVLTYIHIHFYMYIYIFLFFTICVSSFKRIHKFFHSIISFCSSNLISQKEFPLITIAVKNSIELLSKLAINRLGKLMWLSRADANVGVTFDLGHVSEAHLGSYQTRMMELFRKNS